MRHAVIAAIVAAAALMSAAPALSDVKYLPEAPGFIEITGADYDLWRAGNLKPDNRCVPILQGGCHCPDTNASGDDGVRKRAVFVARRVDRCPGPVTPAAISGTWTAMKFTYTITQAGNTFTWTNSGIPGEAATGTIDGTAVKASWKRGMSGDGSATGKVVTDASGRAIRIEWSNGVHFVRK